MVDTQNISVRSVAGVAVAEILRDKITEHENQAVFADLNAAAAANRHRLAVDLGRIGLLSSAGLGGLITLHKACAAQGGRLVIFGVQDQILNLLRLTHLDRLLTVATSRDDALQKAAA